MAIFVYDKDLKKVVPVSAPPVRMDDTRNHVNMRKTWSGTTKVEFSNTTMEEDIARRNNG